MSGSNGGRIVPALVLMTSMQIAELHRPDTLPVSTSVLKAGNGHPIHFEPPSVYP